MSDIKKKKPFTAGEIYCEGGCGRAGYYSDPTGRCTECRKISCSVCGVRFAPNKRNLSTKCSLCVAARRKALNHIADGTEYL